MEIKVGQLFENDSRLKYEVIEVNSDFVLLNLLTSKWELDNKKIKFPFNTFQNLIKNKTFSTTHSRKMNDLRDILLLRTDSDVSLKTLSKK